MLRTLLRRLTLCGLLGASIAVLGEVDISYTVEAHQIILGANNSRAIPASYTGSVEIPGYFEGWPLRAIKESAFQGCHLSSVSLPSMAFDFEGVPFLECPNLTSIDVASRSEMYASVDGVLFTKDRRTLLRFPSGRTGSYSIPMGVTNIAASAFQGSALTSITLRASIETMGVGAFRGCTNLVNVTVPGSVFLVPSECFAHCTSLKSAWFLRGIGLVSEQVFSNCGNLKTIYMPETLANSQKDKTNLGSGCSPTLIGFYADTPTAVILAYARRYPSAVTGPFLASYEYWSFFDNFEHYYFPEGLHTLNTVCEFDASGHTIATNRLAAIEIDDVHPQFTYALTPEGPYETDPAAFTNAGTYSVWLKITLDQDGLQDDPYSKNPPYDMYPFIHEASVTIQPRPLTPDMVRPKTPELYETGLPIENILQFSRGVTSNDVTISFSNNTAPGTASYHVVGKQNFTGVIEGTFTILESPRTTTVNGIPVRYYVHDGNAIVGAQLAPFQALPWTTQGSFSLPDTLDGYPVVGISEDAFSGSDLSELILPNSVTNIGPTAFYGMEFIQSITLSSGLSVFDFSWFDACHGLLEVTIPAGVADVRNTDVLWMESLSRIWVDAANTNFCDVDGVLFTREKSTLLRFPPNHPSPQFLLPNSTTEIAPYAFSSSAVQEVILRSSLTTIGESAFLECENLESMVIPGTVETMGEDLFMHCINLKEVTYLEGITSIGECPFWNCPALEAIYLPSSFQRAPYSFGRPQPILIWVSSEAPVTDQDLAGLNDNVIRRYLADEGPWLFFDEDEFAESVDQPLPPDALSYYDVHASYDGQPHTLASDELERILILDVTAPRVEFAPSNNGPWSTVPCAFTNAGTTSIWYRLRLQPNFYFTHEVRVQIDPRPLEPEFFAPIPDQTFQDTPLTPNVTPLASTIPLTRADFSCTYANNTQPGTASVTITGHGNYSGTLSLPFEIIASESPEPPEPEPEVELRLVNGAYWVIGPRDPASTAIVIPNAVNGIPIVGIDDHAFWKCTLLESIVLPDTLQSIGDGAFWRCEALPSIDLPASVSFVGEAAFFRCTNLTEIILHGNTLLNEDALLEGTSASILREDDTVTSLGIPHHWLRTHVPKPLQTVYSANMEVLQSLPAANVHYTFADCYIAGLDPSDPSASFKVSISFVNQKPVLSWTPDLNQGGTQSLRIYTILGAPELSNPMNWTPVTSKIPPDSLHFFKVSVSLP